MNSWYSDPELIVAISLTVGISALCSTLEAMILSVTSAELESYKKTSPKRGLLMEKFRNEIEETSSAILSLNTIANTLGATLVGGLAKKHLGDGQTDMLWFACGMTLGILFFAEILPKNMTVRYRADMLGKLVFPLWAVRILMLPFSKVCKVTVKAMVPQKKDSDDSDEEEIILLAKKGASKGTLTDEESNWVTNALRLNDVQVHEIMTPRTVMLALDQNLSVQDVFEMHPNVPFARIPLFRETIDHICGIVRRRDLYNANVEEKTDQRLRDLGKEAVFVPENASVDKALRLLLSEHCQLSIVVDEFGSVAGVLAMEDIIETIIGKEIYEDDDMAVDMREFAMRKHKARIKEENTHSDNQTDA